MYLLYNVLDINTIFNAYYFQTLAKRCNNNTLKDFSNLKYFMMNTKLKYQSFLTLKLI